MEEEEEEDNWSFFSLIDEESKKKKTEQTSGKPSDECGRGRPSPATLKHVRGGCGRQNDEEKSG